MNMNTLNLMIHAGVVKFHHSARRMGYVPSGSEGIVELYKGRFGEGFRVLLNDPESRRFCIVNYYIYDVDE